MKKTTLWILIAVVFLSSLLLRLHPTTSESFAYDAVVSQLAAREGIVANALDNAGTYALRRQHPPLLPYIIQLNNRVFGDGPFGARVFSIVFGSLTCLVVAIAIAALLPPVPGRLAAALAAGWLLCLLPVHLYVSRTSNWDAVYGFFATSSLLCLALYLVNGSAVRLYAAAALGTCAFLTCELGLCLLPAAGFVVAHDVGRLRLPRAAVRWAGVLLFIGVLLALLWPAGVFKLDLLRTIAYRWRDSAAAERNAPWYHFYTTLFREAPAFTLFVVVGIVALLLPSRAGDGSRLRSATLPLSIYVATVFVLSLKQRLVYLHHIVDMFPPLVIVACVALATRTTPLTKPGKRWVLGLGTAAIAFSVLAAFNPDPEVVGPQEHPGFLGVSDALQDYPGATVYCHDETVLGFYLPGASIAGGTSRIWTPTDIASAKQTRYDFVVFDRAKLGETFPAAEQIVEALAPEYALKWTITHRRTQEPVAWVLAHSP